ncbi:MATE family efflux transporter [Pyrofollis japonicus]|uniref:MATE family efflux transporter n=1 Tax=Pyrofollis japonicus TaxID=3060460 RepID=UPI00295BA44C|nr:MATE family efflux transporter [Pyrofollis japonicus]
MLCAVWLGFPRREGGMGLRGLVLLVARVMRSAWPLVVAEASFSILNVTDMFFVSRLGAAAVAGVGVGGYVQWLLGTVFTLFYIGGMVLVSQAWGAGKKEEASRVLAETISSSLLFSLGWGVLALLAAPLLVGFVSSDPVTARLGTTYLTVFILGYPFNALMIVLDGVLRGVGANMGVLWGSIVAVVVNAVLDPLLIFYAGFGVAGAALASIAGNFAGAVAMLVLLEQLTGLRLAIAWPGRAAAQVIRVGTPAMVERMLFAGGNYFYIGSVSSCGRDALAAHALGVRVESFAYMPAFALLTYASSEVGQLVGANRLEEAKERGWEIAKASAGFMVLAGLGLIAVSPLVAIGFAPTRTIGKLVILYLFLAAVSEPALGLVMGIGGAIRGAGNTVIPTIINLVGLYAVRVAPSLLLVGRLGGGTLCPLTAWLIMDLDLAVRALVFTYVYKKYFHRLARKLV